MRQRIALIRILAIDSDIMIFNKYLVSLPKVKSLANDVIKLEENFALG